MSSIYDFQVDHLLLLVGSNPVPNAVAGILLTKPGGTISLIHSIDGLDLAQRLKSWLINAGFSDKNISYTQVEESNATLVYDCVQKVLKQREKDFSDVTQARIGLNYTGGTKVMSVHAHRALDDWTNSRGIEAIFSYLDARTLHMRFDQGPGRDATSFYVGRSVIIGINELLALHNWEPIKNPITVPVLPESAKALLTVHSNLTNVEIWNRWLHGELFSEARKRIPIPPPIWTSKSGEPVQEKLEQPAPTNKWKSNTDLQKLEISWPHLPAIRDTLSNELGQYGAEYLDLTAATSRGCKDEQDFCKWLSGTWLESAVLSALQNCPQDLSLKECCMDIRPKVPNSSGGELFQFDVAAMHGFQLFAFSCTSESSNRRLLKQKLFEAYMRARQMGGDEACAALVCCATEKTANELENEMRRDIVLKGRIKVFGHDQLEKLTENIADWIRKQSKEE